MDWQEEKAMACIVYYADMAMNLQKKLDDLQGLLRKTREERNEYEEYLKDCQRVLKYNGHYGNIAAVIKEIK